MSTPHGAIRVTRPLGCMLLQDIYHFALAISPHRVPHMSEQ